MNAAGDLGRGLAGRTELSVESDAEDRARATVAHSSATRSDWLPLEAGPRARTPATHR